VLAALPTSAREMHIDAGGEWAKSATAISALAQALATAGCRASVLKLHLQQAITPAAADAILGSMRGLQDVRITISTCSSFIAASSPRYSFWRPAADLSQLQALELYCSKGPSSSPSSSSSGLVLDLEPLSSAGRLQRLWLEAESFEGATGLGSLHQLRSLTVKVGSKDPRDDVEARVAQALQGLQHLEEVIVMRASSDACPKPDAATWGALAAAPSLARARLDGLTIGASMPVAARLEDLTAWAPGIRLDMPEEQVKGCLARLMPALREAELGVCTVAQLQALYPALQGHPCLRELRVWLLLAGISREAVQKRLASKLPGVNVRVFAWCSGAGAGHW
jgi:hypothetical protein